MVNMIDYEAEYNNRARVPEHPGILARWASDAAAYRSLASEHSEIGVSYGETLRQHYDLFRPATQRGDALVVFIHGGYWQALDPSSFSHMAKGLNAAGVPVAVAGYELCPDVTIAAIIGQMRGCMAALWRRFQVPLVVCGHSAGGHLAACMLATNWTDAEPDLPPQLVRSAFCLSGLFDLAPLLYTSANDKLGLDEASARAASPLFWPAPAGLVLDAVVGSDESNEYHRQSRVFTDIWGLEGVQTRRSGIAGANHFTVIDPLAEPASPMVARIAELAGTTG